MLLQNKNAVIYGGGGAIGGAVARAFGREGGTVFLAGRTLKTLTRWLRISALRAERPRLRNLTPRRAVDRKAHRRSGQEGRRH